MTGPRDFDDARLQAYIDGELDPARVADVEDWLEANPEDAARLAKLRRHDELLRAALAPVLTEPVPRAMREAREKADFRSSPLASRLTRLAAALLLVLAGAVVGWEVRTYRESVNHADNWPARFAERALDAHVVYAADLRHPVEVQAPEREHLDAWLSRRMRYDVAAPDLTAAGFQLLGGRLLAEHGQPAALYMYENSGGKRLTVLINRMRSKIQTPLPKLLVRENLGTFTWVEGQLALAISGELASDRLRGVSELVTMSLRRGA